MAEALLKAWNAPQLVTDVSIDASGPKVVRQEKTLVTNLHADGGLAWSQRDDALPMPLDPNDNVLQLALRASDFVEALDQQPLQVSGLTAPRYKLAIDGEEVGTFTREQLAEGINLAVLPTPMEKQAAQVHELTRRHNEIHFTRWRDVQVPLETNRSRNLSRAIRALDALEADLVKQQRAAARPKERHYQLQPDS
jgi:hypothetical protein